MTDTKKSAPKKKAAPRKKTVAKPKIEVVSYSIKMVIPTVEYGNIQPEIIVRGGTMDECHDFVAPHFNKLWKEYYLVDGRRKAVAPQPIPTPVAYEVGTAPATTTTTTTPSPTSSVAFVKASQAIDSCMSVKALKLIIDQIAVSVKLTPEDKEDLKPLYTDKELELNVKK